MCKFSFLHFLYSRRLEIYCTREHSRRLSSFWAIVRRFHTSSEVNGHPRPRTRATHKAVKSLAPTVTNSFYFFCIRGNLKRSYSLRYLAKFNDLRSKKLYIFPFITFC